MASLDFQCREENALFIVNLLLIECTNKLLIHYINTLTHTYIYIYIYIYNSEVKYLNSQPSE